MSDLIREATGFSLRGSNVKCKHYIDKDLWVCKVDTGQISQVIQNLVINADQALPGGGTISVHASNVTIGPGDRLPLIEGRYVKLTIRDQGHGIPAEHLPKIFDPYFTTKQKGSGLGLATCYSIIKRHNGHIAVESARDAGTTFHFYLPASSEQIEEKEEVREEVIVFTGKILVMDDEREVGDAAAGMLEHLRHEVELAADGAEAIKLYKKARKSERPFDIVILDLTIPGGMGGEETVKKLIEIDPDVKAIVSSGYSNDPVLTDYQDYGFSAVMSKPYRIKEWRKVLRSVLKEKNG